MVYGRTNLFSKFLSAACVLRCFFDESFLDQAVAHVDQRSVDVTWFYAEHIAHARVVQCRLLAD